MRNKALEILKLSCDASLCSAIFDSFLEVERNYFLEHWKTSELDSGHFVEAIRRFIDLRLLGSYIPIDKSLSKFNEQELKRIEAYTGPESLRIHIPRALFAIYSLRNKRGVGHLALISPNYMDATFMKNKPWIPRAGARGGKGFLSLGIEYNKMHDLQTNEPCSL